MVNANSRPISIDFPELPLKLKLGVTATVSLSHCTRRYRLDCMQWCAKSEAMLCVEKTMAISSHRISYQVLRLCFNRSDVNINCKQTFVKLSEMSSTFLHATSKGLVSIRFYNYNAMVLDMATVHLEVCYKPVRSLIWVYMPISRIKQNKNVKFTSYFYKVSLLFNKSLEMITKRCVAFTCQLDFFYLD